jgi:uncharacterized protein (TIGR00162 family)
LSVVKIHKKPKLKNPILVGGLPGSGYVAKLAVDHLVKELDAQLLGEIFSPAFPPQVLVKKDGTVELMRNELYWWRDEKSDTSLMILTGNTQAVSPEGQYDIAEKVLDTAEDFGVKRMFTVAAFVTGERVEKPRVFATATEPKLLNDLKKHGTVPMKEGNIGGTNGLLFGLAKLRRIQGICLLGETSGYIIDAKSAQAVLETLTKILDVRVDMSALENRAKETEAFLRRMQELTHREEQPQPKKEEKGLFYIG